MQETIDFSLCEVLVNTYEGANTKIPIIYQGERYMLKFGETLEPDPKDPNRDSKMNIPLSEYLGSHIFNLIGIPSQDTLLGTYNGREVVACKDFVYALGANRYELVEFNKLESSFFGSSTSMGRTPDYESIIEVLVNHPALSNIKDEAKKRYWEMFIGDALTGNFDRHAGNWGYILNKEKNELERPAPIYDCGGTLYPKLSEKGMAEELSNPDKLEKRVLSYPKATLLVQGKKPSYQNFLLSPEGEPCRDVLLRMYERINLDSIMYFFDQTTALSKTQKEFYSSLIQVRHAKIIQPAYEMALGLSKS